jgi:hypothetical protein
VKHLRYLAVALFLPLLWYAAQPIKRGRADTKPTPILVELFTSEGCSSCPPADEFLGRLNRGQPISGVSIIGIEEHVDYWNHDGWTDPYSSPEWTARQVAYVDHFKESTAYTPQAIIAGEHSVVGVRDREILQAIQQSALQPRVDIDATMEPLASDGVLRIHVRAGKLPSIADDSVELWLAIAERDVAQKVNSGENAGRELRHSAVLRSLRKLGVAKGNTDVSFEASPQSRVSHDWRSQNIEAIVMAQEKKSRRVVGVAVARLAAS